MHPRHSGQGGCGAHPDQPGGSPAGGRVTAIRTTCAYCGVGCGVSATPSAERAAIIKGDAEHPTNRGRLCSKGTHLGERSEEHTSELQSLMRISYAVFCLKKNQKT